MAVMAAGGACFVKRALGVMVLLAILLVAGWTTSGPTTQPRIFRNSPKT
jgi:hypothetical protein